ncbi:MAG TPA: hypothetical protein VF627_11390 [Abditibacterium sp.]|jgi:hypothetical protein
MNYDAAWKNLKIRKVVCVLSLFVAIALLFLYNGFKGRPSPITPLMNQGPWPWFLAAALVVAVAYAWLLMFRCPRCKKTFLYLNGRNKNCANCGLPIDAVYSDSGG